MSKLPKLHNKYHNTAPSNAIYIGRGSAFGNPFIIGRDGDRDEVCNKFDNMVEQNQELKNRIKRELKGRNLVCFCYPKRCHGETLLRIANEE